MMRYCKRLFTLYFSLFILLLLASCGSRKTATQGGMSHGSQEAILQKAVGTTNANRLDTPFLTARINFSANTGSKDFSVGGSLKMKRDDVIQISLVALGIMEAGRLELTKEYIMLVDRMNHRYVKVSYQDIPQLKASGVSFYTFQSLFWNELFILDGEGTVPSEESFSKELTDGSVRMSTKASRSAMLSFLTNAADGLIQETNVASAENITSPLLQWQYADFTKVQEQQFPTRMKMRFGGSKPIEATIRLSNIKNDSDWETRTNLSSRYSQVSLDAIIKMVMSLSL